jgi:hypothetical protein
MIPLLLWKVRQQFSPIWTENLKLSSISKENLSKLLKFCGKIFQNFLNFGTKTPQVLLDFEKNISQISCNFTFSPFPKISCFYLLAPPISTAQTTLYLQKNGRISNRKHLFIKYTALDKTFLHPPPLPKFEWSRHHC